MSETKSVYYPGDETSLNRALDAHIERTPAHPSEGDFPLETANGFLKQCAALLYKEMMMDLRSDLIERALLCYDEGESPEDFVNSIVAQAERDADPYPQREFPTAADD